jgi:hypothetical protein
MMFQVAVVRVFVRELTEQLPHETSQGAKTRHTSSGLSRESTNGDSDALDG